MFKCFKQEIDMSNKTFMFLVSRKTLKFHNNNCTLKCNLIKRKINSIIKPISFTIDFFKKDYNNIRHVFLYYLFYFKAS